MAEMTTTARTATTMPAFEPVLRVFMLVTSLAGCGEVKGKDDEDTVVARLLVLMFMDLGAMNTLGRDEMRLVAMERLESDDMRLFAVVAAIFRLDVAEIDAAGAPKLLVMSASVVEVVGLGSGREAQVIGS